MATGLVALDYEASYERLEELAAIFLLGVSIGVSVSVSPSQPTLLTDNCVTVTI